MKYKAIIFDLDGTLLDTLDDLGAAVNHALGKHGYPLHTREEYAGMVGHGVRNLVQQALPAGVAEALDECFRDFMDYYTSNIDTYTRPYPGMAELLKELDSKGIGLGVASNKFQSGTEYLVGKLFPGIRFAAIMGNREGYPLKPDPAIVETVLKATGAKKEEAALVGDSLTDMKTAANAGIPGIAVGWGYRDMSDSPLFAPTVEELRSLIGL